MLTESLFADECEPFFNSIDPKRTLARPNPLWANTAGKYEIRFPDRATVGR